MIEWLFTQTIFGIAALAFVIYGVAAGMKRIVPKAPPPAAVAIVGFVLLLATLPSYPRYKFEKSVQTMIDNNPHMRVVTIAEYGGLLEPLTWFRAPVGFVHVVGPENPLAGGGFRRVILSYEEDPEITFEEPDCEDGSILISMPDAEGTVRYTTQMPEPMTREDQELYCESDWSAENAALMQMLRDSAR